MPITRVLHRNYPAMNSVLDIVLTQIDEKLGERVCSAISELARQCENMLSCHSPGAEVYQLNQTAFANFTPVSPPLFELLKACKSYHNSTKGYFDVGLKNFRHDYPVMASGNGIDAVELDEASLSVRFRLEHTAIDLGGIGKGVLLREVEKVLTHYDVTNCFISFGGSSILTRGTHPHGEGWPLALRNSSDNAYTFYLHNHAVSISESNPGGSGAHIIHPVTGKLVDGNRLTFIQALCPVVAEVLSTTLIIAPLEEAEELVQSFNPEKAYIFDNSDPDQLKLLYRFD